MQEIGEKASVMGAAWPDGDEQEGGEKQLSGCSVDAKNTGHVDLITIVLGIWQISRAGLLILERHYYSCL